MMKLLITGGAGYIGSHCTLRALELGYEVSVVDSLERGYEEAIRRVQEITGKTINFYMGDLRDLDFVLNTVGEILPDCIIHFAAYKSVGESQINPEMYMDNNVHSVENIIKACKKYSIKKFIFSSTAAVYGNPDLLPITESHPTPFLSAYGESKKKAEEALDKASKEMDFTPISMRYFNVVGAHESGHIGEDPSKAANLIPLVMNHLLGNTPDVKLFGNSFETFDGTQERDYIHVMDLVEAHLIALDKTLKPNTLHIFNLSTGIPTSCKQIFDLCEKQFNKKIHLVIAPPRDGDPVRSYADPKKAKEILGWQSTRSIEKSVRDQYNWMINNPKGYSKL